MFASRSPISPSLGNGGNGDEYSFTLLSLTDSGGGNFSGAGMLIDSLGNLQNTPAIFSLSFSDGYNYSVSLTAVPEPSTLGVVGAGLASFALMAYRRSRK